ncbi:chromatin-remodeling ATPase INO80-like [Daucus carota subsp. sativus]|uniref:chromatin-remodeling ATPase INO80-like n=1 Tax=Daucus carota subsp. sativus TaxID=79200 RepID=UPI003083E969
MNIVYYSRFCQLIFSYCFPDVPLPEDGNELPFKITKRAFTDLIKKDSKKNVVPVFAIPVTVQDKLKIALPDKYEALFSDENIPQPPSPDRNPIVTADPKPTSGSSQQGPVVISSPKRVLRSSRSPSKQPSPPPRKRRFLQKISDSESEEDIPPPPPAKKLRKKIKATSVTDLTVEPPQSDDPKQPLIPFSDQSAEPLLIEPISAVPLDIAAANQQMSESTPDHNDQSEGAKSVEEKLAADILVSETVPAVPNQSEDAQIELVLQMIQDSLLQPEVLVAAPAQEITEAANSDAATEALEMCRTTSPSVEDRLTSIEATQASMNYTLADLSASVAQLVQQLKRKKPDDDEAEKGEINKQQKLKLLQSKETKKNSREAASSERPPRESQKHRSMELTVVTQAQNITKAVRDSDALSKEIDLVNSEVEKKKENLFRGKETTLFYKSPSLQAIDEAMARKIFEKENPGVDIEAIRLEEERLAAEKKKISKTKSDEQRQITDSSQKQEIPKKKGIVISEVNYTDINRPRTRSQTQSESDIADKGKKPVDGVPSATPLKFQLKKRKSKKLKLLG